MYLGMIEGKVCRTNRNSPNQSVCITGMSGTGKTTRMNRMEIDTAKNGGLVVVLDINQTHTVEHMYSGLRAEFSNRVNRIDATKDGLGVSLLMPMRTIQGQEESFVHLVNSAVCALSSSQNMGVRQIGVLRMAVIDAIKKRWQFQNDAEALGMSLLQMDNDIADVIYQKLWTVLNCGALKPSDKQLVPGIVNIIEFSGMDMLTKTALSEIFMSCLWRNVQFCGISQQISEVDIFLDEFQNMPLGREAVLRDMLREGRKFGMNLVLGTQTVGAFPKDIVLLLNQAATKLYFRPTVGEVRKIVKEAYGCVTQNLIDDFMSLEIGESVALGDMNVEGQEIRRPLILR